MAWRNKLCIFIVQLFTTVLLSCVQLTKADHSCNFDNGLCYGWSQSNQGDFEWTNRNGWTPSYGTGLNSDHSGHGKYMYIETSSPRQYGDIASLDFSVSRSDIGKLSCLKFYYHMYGDTINTLNVYSGNTQMFSRSGKQGDEWLKAEITMTLQSTVTFEGISGASFTGGIAIDDVSIVERICQGCNFDNGLCSGWSQSNQDDFDWTNRNGWTPSYGTGPNSDHSGHGKYMYIETSSPRQYGDIARLDFFVSRSDIGKLSCLKFHYHMYGDSINALNVYNGKTKMFARSGKQGDEWLKAEITMTLQSKVTFEGIAGDSYTGGIAIDDVFIFEGICQGCLASCDFDSGLCDGWQQSKTNVFYWTCHAGSTPSSFTGPDNDHTSGSGYYMYIETSDPRVAGDKAILEFTVCGNGQLSCLTFYYHMYGDTMGTLTVFSGNMVVFNTSGNHGHTWVEAKRTIYLNKTVTFEGTVGSSFTGDLAIDDVSITNGSCQANTPTTKTFKPDISTSTFSPKPPSLKLKQESIMLEVRGLDIKKWDEQMESDFKRKVARAATDFCAADGSRCEFTATSSRRKRLSNNMVFTSDMVHILPGYPKKSPDDPTIILLAFYLQLPQGSSDGVVNKDVLKAIVESDVSSVEGSIGGTILSFQPLPLTDTSEINDESDKEPTPTVVIIAACVGGVFLLAVIIGLVLACKRSNRSNTRRTKKKEDNSCNISGEEDIEMKSENPTYLPGNAPDQNPEEQYYAAIYDQPVSTGQSKAILKFPETFPNKSSEGVNTATYQQLEGEGASIYQQLDGEGASIYQQLHSGPKFPEALPQKNSNGNAASIYQVLNNGPKPSEA